MFTPGRLGRAPALLAMLFATLFFTRCACTDSVPPVAPLPDGCGTSCPQGETCVAGQCAPETCAGSICNADEVCQQGRCLSRECVGVQCPGTQLCVDGNCYLKACGDDACGVNEACVNGSCQDARCVGVACPAGQDCANGTCYPRACGTVVCATGEVCVGNACTERRCVGVACPTGEFCSQGACSRCPPDFYPEGDQCLPKVGTGASCGGDRQCHSGQCMSRAGVMDRVRVGQADRGAELVMQPLFEFAALARSGAAKRIAPGDYRASVAAGFRRRAGGGLR
jgi:hypothetical protein